MSMGEVMAPVASVHIPSKRELRMEARWRPWREEKAMLLSELLSARREELERKIESESAQAARELLEKQYKRVLRRGGWMLVRDGLMAPFRLLASVFERWMSTPDMRRQ